MPNCKPSGIGVLLVPAILCCRAHAMPADGGNTVQGFYDVLLSTMKSGRTLGQSGRFAQLEPVVRQTFDIPGMARLSIGALLGRSHQGAARAGDRFGRYI